MAILEYGSFGLNPRLTRLLASALPDEMSLYIQALADSHELPELYGRNGIHGYPKPLGYSRNDNLEVVIFESPGGSKELRNIVGNLTSLESEKGVQEAVHQVQSKKPPLMDENHGTSFRLYETERLLGKRVSIQTLRITVSEGDRVQIACLRPLDSKLDLKGIFDRSYRDCNLSIEKYEEIVDLSKDRYFRFYTRKPKSGIIKVEMEILDNFELNKLNR